MINKKLIGTYISSALILFAVAVIVFFFVPTHDDLIDLSIHNWEDSFRESLFYGNGRFLGNTTVSVFLNNNIFDLLFRTVTIGGIIILSAIITNGYKTNAIVLSGFLYLGISIPIFRQSFVWGHGFYNYVPPVFCLLIVLCLIKFCINKDTRKCYCACAPIVFLVSFSAQLFAENSSTINGLIFLIALFWSYKTKKGFFISLTAVLGAALGAICMFFGPTLLGVGDRLNDYRSVSSSLSEYIVNAARNAFEILNTLSANWGLWLVISGLVFLLEKIRENHICFLFKTMIALFPIVSIFQGFNTVSIIKLAVDVLFLFYIACIAVAFYKLLDKTVLKAILLFAAIAFMSIVQLLVVTPIGPRCLFVSVSILSVGILYVFSIINEEHPKLIKKYINGVVFLSIAVYIAMLTTYIQAWRVHCVRMEYAFEQLSNGNKQIEIIELPFEAMFHCPNDSYVYPYTFNHGDKDEMSFVYISYEEFLERKN